MTKTQEIVKMIRDGNSDFEIMETYEKCDQSFLKRCHTFAKKEVDKEDKAHEQKKVTNRAVNPSKESNKPSEAEVTTQAPIQAQLPADMMSLFTQFCAQLSNGQAPVVSNTCNRHLKQSVKAGENCPLCLKASRLDYEREKINKFAPPCPKCNEGKYFKHGGVIRKTRTKGIFACGQCQITYSMTGEMTDWKDNKDLKHVK